MEEIKAEGNGINVDEYLANLKAKETATQTVPGLPKTTDVLRPPDPMDIKPGEIEEKEVDPDAEPIKMQWIKGEKTGSVEEVDREDGDFIIFKSGGRVNKGLKDEYLVGVDKDTLVISVEDELRRTPPPSLNQAKAVTLQKSPVATLLEKSSQTEELAIKLSVKINAPTPGLMSILIDSFGDEAIEEVKKFIIAQVDTKALTEAAGKKVEEIISNSSKKAD